VHTPPSLAQSSSEAVERRCLQVCRLHQFLHHEPEIEKRERKWSLTLVLSFWIAHDSSEKAEHRGSPTFVAPGPGGHPAIIFTRPSLGVIGADHITALQARVCSVGSEPGPSHPSIHLQRGPCVQHAASCLMSNPDDDASELGPTGNLPG
jgi:hypothetical protein